MDPLPYVLQTPALDPDDLNQELVLRRLEGSRITRAQLLAELAINDGPIFQGDLGADAIAPAFTPSPMPSYEVIEQIVQWTLQQSELIQSAVFDFLDDPDSDRLDDLLHQLGLSLEKTTPRPTLSALLTRYLQYPQTLEDLYTLARECHPSRRPEAAVRQYLRRAIKLGKVVELEPGLYQVKGVSL